MPTEWKEGALNDLCVLKKDSCQPSDSKSNVYIGLEHIESGRFSVYFYGKPEQVVSSKNCFSPNDILYGKLRPYLDKAAVATTEGICSTDILVFTPKENIPPFYLVGLLHTDRFIQYAIQTTHGLNHPRTSWGALKDFQILVPPVSEQQKIAAVLFKIQNAIEIQESIIEKTRELKKSTMHHVFTHGLRGEKLKETEIGLMPESWGVRDLDSVLKLAQYGLSVRGLSNGQYPILRMNCQIDGQVHLNDLQYVNLDNDIFKKFKMENGDILFNRTNSWELVGRTAIYRSKEAAVFASYLIRLRLDENEINSGFLNHFFNMDATQNRLKSLASRGVSQSNISASKLKTFKIPMPAMDEQLEIINILHAIDQKIEIHTAKKSALQELFKTLLNKLMTGDIRVKDLDIDVSEVES